MTARGVGPRRRLPGGARRASRTATWSPASATSSARPSTSPRGSPRSPGPGSVLIDRGAHDALTGDTGDRGPPRRRARRARARRLLLPADAAYVGEGLLATAVLGAPPGRVSVGGTGYRPLVSLWDVPRGRAATAFSGVSADGDLTVGQPGASRPLVGGQRRTSRPAPRRGPPRTSRPGPPAPRRRCRRAGPRPGASRPWARNMPTSRAPSTITSWPADVQPGQRVEQLVLGLRHHPAQVLLGADVGPVRRLDLGQPRGRVGGGVGLLQRGREVVLVLDVGDPEVEAVVDGDRQLLVRHQVLEPRPVAGRVGEADDAGLVGVDGAPAAPRRGRGTGRRSCAAPAGPARAGRCRAPSPAPPSAAASRAAPACRCPCTGQRRGRRGHQLAHRDDVALRGQPLERPGDVDASGAALGSVAGLVALARAARAGLARPDLAGSGRSRALVRDFFAMPANVSAATCRAAPACRPGGR